MKKFGAILCALISMICAITAAQIHTAAGVNPAVVFLGAGFVAFTSAAGSLWRSARKDTQVATDKDAQEVLEELAQKETQVETDLQSEKALEKPKDVQR